MALAPHARRIYPPYHRAQQDARRSAKGLDQDEEARAAETLMMRCVNPPRGQILLLYESMSYAGLVRCANECGTTECSKSLIIIANAI